MEEDEQGDEIRKRFQKGSCIWTKAERMGTQTEDGDNYLKQKKITVEITVMQTMVAFYDTSRILMCLELA